MLLTDLFYRPGRFINRTFWADMVIQILTALATLVFLTWWFHAVETAQSCRGLGFSVHDYCVHRGFSDGEDWWAQWIRAGVVAAIVTCVLGLVSLGMSVLFLGRIYGLTLRSSRYDYVRRQFVAGFAKAYGWIFAMGIVSILTGELIGQIVG